MRGVPLRLEIGPKDVEKDQCVLVRRDTREKAFVALAAVAQTARDLLTSIQDGLLDRARRFVADHTTRVSTYEEFKRVMADKRGFIVTGWCRSADCEAKIKEETKATVRVIPIEGTPAPGACVRCGQPSSGEVYFAQAY
jgi:prolyl-tRNA synthetase